MFVKQLAKGTRWLAIDDSVMALREDLGYYITRPTVRSEPVLRPSPRDAMKPDNIAASFYGTVIEDTGPFGGRFRMWYHACHWPMNPDWPLSLQQQFAKYDYPLMAIGPACYAESHDGIDWFKPELHQLSFYGSTANNAVNLKYAVNYAVNVIRDDDDPDSSRRYKMLYQFDPRFSKPPLDDAGCCATMAAAVSADGIHWVDHGIPAPNRFMEMSGFFQFGDKYIMSSHTIGTAGSQGNYRSEGGYDVGRTGVIRYSYDFDRWAPGFVDSFNLEQPREPKLRGPHEEYMQTHLGVSATDIGGVCIGLYGRWHAAPDISNATCDLGLVISNDGLRFREPVRGHVFLDARNSPARAHPQRQFHTVLCQGNGILHVGDETRIYHGRWRNTGFSHLDKYYTEIGLATIPRDRWGALSVYPKHTQGTLWTEPVRLDAAHLTLNATGGQRMRIEIADTKFNLLPDFSGNNAGIPIANDGLDLGINWPHVSPRALGDRPVRVKVTIRQDTDKPMLFAMNGTTEERK